MNEKLENVYHSLGLLAEASNVLPPRLFSDLPSNNRVAALRSRVVAWIFAQNQFVRVTADDTRKIERSCEVLVRRLEDLHAASTDEEAREQQLRELFSEYERHIGDLVQEIHRTHYGEGPVRQVPCVEYTVELQLGLLGVRVEDLEEPILDIGSGPNAALVQALRAQGKTAFGLERSGSAHIADIITEDWLEHSFEPNRWGTVLSHQAFSLHFLHHHSRDAHTAEAYAHTYMRILRSLRVGGLFAYTPALPFIEHLLPHDTYRIEHISPAALMDQRILGALEQKLGPDIVRATHVFRLR